MLQLIIRIILALAPLLPVDTADRRPVLLVVTDSVSCAQCIKDKPTVDKIRKLGRVQVVIVEFNDKDNAKLVQYLKVKGTPTYLLWDQAKEIGRTHDVQIMYKAIKGAK